VWKILAVTAVIIAIYQLVIPRLVPAGGNGHDQRQDNLIKAQRLIYHHVAPTTIVVGSSELDRLTLPADVYNLALSGGSALTGLEIVLRSDVQPRRVVVEISDAILREPDPAFLDSLFGVVDHPLRGAIPVLQDAYQPGVLINHVAQTWATAHAVVADDHVRPELYEKLIAAQVKAHATAPDILTLERIVVALRRAVDALHTRGVEVVFVEPPEAPEVCASRESTAIRDAMHRSFSDVRWLPDPDCASYQTTDGVHLDRASADRFATVLVNAL
jgi:hypothetical protein